MHACCEEHGILADMVAPKLLLRAHTVCESPRGAAVGEPMAMLGKRVPLEGCACARPLHGILPAHGRPSMAGMRLLQGSGRVSRPSTKARTAVTLDWEKIL